MSRRLFIAYPRGMSARATVSPTPGHVVVLNASLLHMALTDSFKDPTKKTSMWPSLVLKCRNHSPRNVGEQAGGGFMLTICSAGADALFVRLWHR